MPTIFHFEVKRKFGEEQVDPHKDKTAARGNPEERVRPAFAKRRRLEVKVLHLFFLELKHNAAINLKKADKGSVTEKHQEGLFQLNNRDHYLPLEKPMVTETLQKAKEPISQLHNDKYIDDMTKNGFLKLSPHQGYLSSTP